jgi:hypothetical protein
MQTGLEPWPPEEDKRLQNREGWLYACRLVPRASFLLYFQSLARFLTPTSVFPRLILPNENVLPRFCSQCFSTSQKNVTFQKWFDTKHVPLRRLKQITRVYYMTLYQPKTLCILRGTKQFPKTLRATFKFQAPERWSDASYSKPQCAFRDWQILGLASQTSRQAARWRQLGNCEDMEVSRYGRFQFLAVHRTGQSPGPVPTRTGSQIRDEVYGYKKKKKKHHEPSRKLWALLNRWFMSAQCGQEKQNRLTIKKIVIIRLKQLNKVF